MKNLYKYVLVSMAVITAILLNPVLSLAATNEPVATASEVLVVYNSDYTTDSNSDSVQDSLEIANYYKSARSIPSQNILGIDAPTTLAITRSDYNTYIKEPIEDYLTDSNLKDTIKYIVFIKGIPLKVYDTSGIANNYVNSNGNYSSVDSSATLLFQNDSSNNPLAGANGFFNNPYFNADPNWDLNNRFKAGTIQKNNITIQYLVTRLDGYTVADVKSMIDRAVNTDKSGTGYFVLDRYNLLNNQVIDYMNGAASNLNYLGKNVYPDPFGVGQAYTTSVSGSVMGYTGYGIHAGLPINYYNNTLDFTYLNGAVASTYESYTSFSLTEPDNTGHGQIAQFIRAGGSGGVGNVYEPYSIGVAREDVMYSAYSVGYTWADSAYMGLQMIDWTGVVYGDPLMRIVKDNISVPSVTTGSATNITESAVALTATLNDKGGEDNIKHGFEYGINSYYGLKKQTTGSFDNGSFSLDITDLSCGTTYYYRAFSANSFKPGYGSEGSFTTSTCTKPVVTTNTTTSVTSSSAQFNGNIIFAGASSVTERGFEYGTTTNLGAVVKENSSSFNAVPFSITADNLLCNTPYYVRAYAENSNGKSYGLALQFTTSNNCAPVTNTISSEKVSDTEFNLVGQIASTNNLTATERGFEYGTNSAFSGSVKTNGNFGGSFDYVSQFGGYGNSDGKFNAPRAMAMDSSGNIYVADRLNHRIQKFDSNGNFIAKWGSFGTNNGQFKYPRGVAVDAQNNIYITDSDNYRVQKFDSNGNFITKWGSYGTGNGRLSYPQDVVVDSQGNVWVSDYENYRIQKFTSTGTYIMKFGSYGSGDGQFIPAYDLAIDANDNIYVADRSNNRVQKFDSNGNFLMKFGSNGTGDGQFVLPSGVEVDTDGNIYVADANNNRIQKFDSNGNFVAKWGAIGSGDGNLSNPQGLMLDNNNNILVADYGNHRIQKFSLDGKYQTLLTSLSCGTTYNYRAYSINSAGTGYGNTQTFTTDDCPGSVPTVSTNNTTNTKQTSVSLYGEISYDSGSTITSQGFEYGTTTSYGTTTQSDWKYDNGSYYKNLAGLACGTAYNYRAYATNSIGTSYGQNKTFTTSDCTSAPQSNISILFYSNLKESSVTLNSAISANSSSPITSQGFEYGTTTSYGTTTQSDWKYDNGSYYKNLAGLACGTTYHYRAYEVNSNSTNYSQDKTFTTKTCS